MRLFRLVPRLAPALLCAALFTGETAPTRLDVSATPEGAKIWVDGELRGVAEASPLSVFALKGGVHLVHVEAPNRVSADDYVTVGEGEFVQRAYALEAEKGLLLVKSEPAGADVRLGGVSLGVTPLVVSTLESGKSYQLELARNGYGTKRVEVKLASRAPVVCEERLTLDSGTVEVTSEPAGAEVTVNGIARGTTPCTVDCVPKGAVNVALRLAGYRDETRTLSMQAGGREACAVKLRAKPARLTVVSTPEGARVFVGDDYQGKTPTDAWVDAGARKLRLELSGHATVTRDVTLAPGEEKTETFTLESVMGRLEVITMPPGARITLDGKSVGTTRGPQSNGRSDVLAVDKLAAGEHSLVAHLDGHFDVSRRIRIPAKDTLKLHVKLSRAFVPNTEVETVRGVMRGVLVSQDPVTGVVLETAPGVEVPIAAKDIRRIKAIAAE